MSTRAHCQGVGSELLVVCGKVRSAWPCSLLKAEAFGIFYIATSIFHQFLASFNNLRSYKTVTYDHNIFNY